MQDKTKAQLEQLSRQFNLAEQTLEEIQDPDLCPTVAIEGEIVDESLPAVVQPMDDPVFGISELKSDFQLVRQNLIKLVATGQSMLDQARVLDVADLKASQLEGLSSLQNAIGKNLRLLINVYRDICQIEHMKNGGVSQQPVAPIVQNVDKQIVFTGSTSDLLTQMKNNK